MATKTEKAVKRAFLRGKNQGKVREEKHVLGLLTAIIIILLFLLFAQHFGWWPYAKPKLGTAFYTNISATTTPPKNLTISGNSGSSSRPGTHSGAGTGSAGTSGSGGGSSSGSSGGGTAPIATFAAGVNVGDTKAQTSAQASGLSQNCSIVAKASTSDKGLGQQQVCVYTQGNKIVTVTYLNGQVISASKSGF